jgi:hypothetical protein
MNKYCYLQPKGGVGKTTTAVIWQPVSPPLKSKHPHRYGSPRKRFSRIGYNEVQEEDIHEALDLAENPTRNL